MEVSAEIAVMIEQETERRRGQARDLELRKKWREKVRRAIDLLRACVVVDDARPSVIVRERWLPAATAALACASAAQIKGIDLPVKGIALMFHRLLDAPESSSVQESVVVDLGAVFARVPVPREELFEPFRILAGEFDTLLSVHSIYGWPKWFLTGPQEIPFALEMEPGVKEIRARLAHNRAGVEKALRVYVELCRDPRDVIPRSDLGGIGLPPTAVDRVSKSPADVTDSPRGFTKTFLLRYVRCTWRPRKSKGVAEAHVQSTTTVIG